MGNKKPSKNNSKKNKKKACDEEPEFLGTRYPDQTVAADEERVNEDRVNEEERVNEDRVNEEERVTEDRENEERETAEGRLNEDVQDEEPLGFVEMAHDHENPEQPNRKKHRGPTRLKNITKAPNTREKLRWNSKGQPLGPGSVKLSSYVGILVREHVPFTIDDWRKVSTELRTVLLKSVQAMFEVDEDYKIAYVLGLMGNNWRSSKSRLVSKIRSKSTMQERMTLRPPNITQPEWRKFVKVKTSKEFAVVSESMKKKRELQIPHTCSRKGMSRLEDELKEQSEEPDEVTRLDVWVKSRTKKDGTPVNTKAAEKFKKAAELVKNADSSSATNPLEDSLSQLLGPDNPGRLRAMGKNMSKSKLACFQMNQQLIEDMKKQQHKLVHQVNTLEDELKRYKQQPATEIGENSASARGKSVNTESQGRCVLIDCHLTDEKVAEGVLLSSDPDDFVDDIPLGPEAVRVLVDKAIVSTAFLWRPTADISTVDEAVGLVIAWPLNKCLQSHHSEDIFPGSPRISSLNKCKLLDWTGKIDGVVGEGRWQSKDPTELVNGIPLGPNQVKVFLDVVHVEKVFLWRPTAKIRYLGESLKSFISWPANKCDFEDTIDTQCRQSTLQPHTMSSKSQSQKTASKGTTSASPASNSHKKRKETDSCPPAPVKKNPPQLTQSPLRRSLRHTPSDAPKQNQKCMLMDISGEDQVVAVGHWETDDPEQTVHFVPLGDNGAKVWVDIVNVNSAAVWRPSPGIECLLDAMGSVVAWPKDKLIMC